MREWEKDFEENPTRYISRCPRLDCLGDGEMSVSGNQLNVRCKRCGHESEAGKSVAEAVRNWNSEVVP